MCYSYLSRHIIISNIQEHSTIFFKKRMNGLSLNKNFVYFCGRTGKYDFWVISRNISVRQVELLGFDFLPLFDDFINSTLKKSSNMDK